MTNTLVLQLDEWAEWIITHETGKPYFLKRQVRVTGATCYKFRIKKETLDTLPLADPQTPIEIEAYDHQLVLWASLHCLSGRIHTYQTPGLEDFEWEADFDPLK